MTDQNKIILMTKLALYEKKYMKQDKARINYFIEDYIYLNNFKARIGVTIITLFFVVIGVLNIFNEGLIFPTSLWQCMDIYLKPYFLPWLVAIIIYTLASTALSGKKYQESTKRFKSYKELLKQLERYEEVQNTSKGASDEI